MAQHHGAAADAVRQGRTVDGSWNDLQCPMMGATGRRFGRNVALQEAFPDTANLLTPSPRAVSTELMTRHSFQPATILNLLAHRVEFRCLNGHRNTDVLQIVLNDSRILTRRCAAAGNTK